MNTVFLSYLLSGNTPTFGNRERFLQTKISDMNNGALANNTSIAMGTHIGTHIDMPCHFFKNAQTIENFDSNFWVFTKILFLEVNSDNIIINKELIQLLEKEEDIGYEIIIIKTGICYIRDQDEYWSNNFGFHSDLYDFINTFFPSVRVFGFDSISISSFKHKEIGIEAHRSFLNPKNPILILEDMDLRYVNKNTEIIEIIVAPLRIDNCDGIPCSILAKVHE